MATKKALVMLDSLMLSMERFALDYIYDMEFCWLWGFVRIISKEIPNDQVPMVTLALFDTLNTINADLTLGWKRSEITTDEENETYKEYIVKFMQGLRKSIRKDPRA